MRTYDNYTSVNKSYATTSAAAHQLKSNNGAYLTDNRPSSLSARRLIQRSVTGRIAQLVGPGDPAPSTQSRLTSRFQEMSGTAGITGKVILDETIRLMTVNIAPPAPVLHPLQPLTAQEVVAIGLQRQLAQDNLAIPDVSVFKGFLANTCLDMAVQNNVIPGMKDAIDELIDPWEADATRALHLSDVTNTNEELRDAVAGTTPQGDQLAKAAETYLANANRPVINELTPQQRTQLSQRLRNMPVVQSMLNGTLHQHGDGGADLLRGIETTGGAVQTQQFTDRLMRGLSILSGLVNSAVLPPAERIPNVQINPDEQVQIPQTAFERLMNIQRTYVREFRADANRVNNRVRLSALTAIDTVVHEFGHQIEFNLPAAEWLDIQELLRMRHAGGGLVSIYPNSPDERTRREPAYNANMPATGLYSAKVYDDSATEVMSMTLEYFSTPENAARMIDNDPLQAAIILRIIQPQQFTANVPANLRALLPRGDIARHEPGDPAPLAPVGARRQQAIFDAIDDDGL